MKEDLQNCEQGLKCWGGINYNLFILNFVSAIERGVLLKNLMHSTVYLASQFKQKHLLLFVGKNMEV